jgi:hypothetical protein
VISELPTISNIPIFPCKKQTQEVLLTDCGVSRLLISDWKQCQISKATHAQTQKWGASRNRCCRGKAIGFTYSECVSVALVIQHAKPMRRVMLTSVACLAVPYLTDGTFVQELLNKKMCIFIFSTTFVWNNSHSKNKCTRHYHKCTPIFMERAPYFCQILNSLEIFSKNPRT